MLRGGDRIVGVELGLQRARRLAARVERERDAGVTTGGGAVADLAMRAREPVVEVDAVGDDAAVLVLEHGGERVARARPLPGVEQQVGKLAAGREVLRVEVDGARERVAGAGRVADLAGDLAARDQVAAQPRRLLGGAAQLVEDRRELDQRAGVLAQLDERVAGLVVVRVGAAGLLVQLLGAVDVAERDREVGGVGQPARALADRPLGGGDQEVDRGRELAAVAHDTDQRVDRRCELGVVVQRVLVVALRAVVVD